MSKLRSNQKEMVQFTPINGKVEEIDAELLENSDQKYAFHMAMGIIHGQAKKIIWGSNSQGTTQKICRPPSAAGKFFTWGASSLGTFAIFKLLAPILEGGGTYFTLGRVHF